MLRTALGSYPAKWFFKPGDATLVGFESSYTNEEDPCEVYCYDFKEVNGVKLPHTFVVRWGEKPYCTMTITSYTLGKK